MKYLLTLLLIISYVSAISKNISALKVFQTSDYYPFGLSFNAYQADRLTASDGGTYQTELRNRYLFQGKELQRDLDLNWYDMSAGMMDPSLGRFLSIDPKAGVRCGPDTLSLCVE